MPGWMYLHPVSQASLGMGLEKRWINSDDRIPYILPGTRQVRTLRKLISAKNIEWMTFDQFVRRLIPQTAERLMSPVEQYWLVQQAVTELEAEQGFSYFAAVQSSSEGWIQTLERMIGELKRSGVTPERLQRLWQNKGTKFTELASIYERYQTLLKQLHLYDHEQAYLEMLGQIQQQKMFPHLPQRLILEHFHDLNPLQEQLLKQLVTVGVDVHLHILWDETRPRLRTIVEPLRDRLQPVFQIIPVNRNLMKTLDKRDNLHHLSENVFSSEPLLKQADGSIAICSAPGIQAEVEQIVTHLKQWLYEENASCSEVAIIVSEMETYEAQLFQKLDQAGIPVNMEYSKKMSDHCLYQTIAAAFEIRNGNREWFHMLLLNPNLPWLQNKQKEYFKIMQKWQNPIGLQELNQTGTEKLPIVGTESIKEVLTSLFQWLESIPERQTWTEWISWFKEWIQPLKKQEQWKVMAQDPIHLQELTETMNAWHSLEQLIKQWETLQQGHLSEQMIDRSRFFTTWKQAAEQMKVKLKPKQRGGVHLLEAKQVRGDQFRAVLILGCVEGKWPRAYSDNWLLPDQERNSLRQEEVLLDLSRELRQRQLIPFFMSVNAATEHLVLSYPHTDEEGKRELASIYLEECTAVFAPGTVVERHKDLSEQVGPAQWGDCYSLEKGIEYAIAHFTQSHTNERDERANSILQHFREQLPERWQSLRDRIWAERSRWEPAFTSFDGVIQAEHLQKRMRKYLEKKVWSATTLNQLMTCRFHFMADAIWKAKEPNQEVEGISHLQKGEILHQVFCRFWNEYKQGKWSFRDEKQAETRLIQIADEYIDLLVKKDRQQTRKALFFRIEKKKLQQHILSFWRYECEWRKQIAFFEAPRYLELSFGMPLDPCKLDKEELDKASMLAPVAIALSSGKSIYLKGKIDRVDVDNEGYYAVYDYKSGTSTPTGKELREGKQLQLPFYLWVLQQGFGFDPEKAMGTAFYTSSSRNNGLWKKELNKRMGITARTLLEPEEWQQVEQRISLIVDERINRSKKADFAVDPTWGCPEHCSHRKLCRIDLQRLALKKQEDLAKGEFHEPRD